MALQQDETAGQVTSVHLPEDLRERLDELVRITGRSRNDLVVEALTSYVDSGMTYLGEIALARRDVVEGRTLTMDELNAQLRARGFLDGR